MRKATQRIEDLSMKWTKEEEKRRGHVFAETAHLCLHEIVLVRDSSRSQQAQYMKSSASSVHSEGPVASPFQSETSRQYRFENGFPIFGVKGL